jgi:hypothetical protein
MMEEMLASNFPSKFYGLKSKHQQINNSLAFNNISPREEGNNTIMHK